MGHHHHEVNGKNLFITIILNIVITLAQIIGGIFSGSLALISDAIHNFSDVLSLVIAWGANKTSKRPSTHTKTFGFKRIEILATLFNASALVGIAVFILFEAVEKLSNPQEIDSFIVIWLGLFSIVLNALSVFLIKDDAHKNMNVKAAYLHLLTDVMTSVAVVIGGVLMYYWQLFWIDPIVSIIIAVYLIYASYGLIKESTGILMQFAPSNIDVKEIASVVSKIDAIDNIHHIHLWRLNDHDIFLEAHIDFTENLSLDIVTIKIEELEELLKKEFHITHITIQPEFNKNDDKEIVIIS